MLVFKVYSTAMIACRAGELTPEELERLMTVGS
jgi:hypothetical protein